MHKLSITEAEITEIQKLAYQSCGISLAGDRSDFLLSRLGKRISKLGVSSFSEYIELLSCNKSSSEFSTFIDEITTHTTSFFRESAQFKWLSESGMNEIKSLRGPSLDSFHVWSAACSTGQELYSAIMVMDDWIASTKSHSRVFGLGTDVSSVAIAKAASGIYRAEDIIGVPEAFRSIYIQRNRHSSEIFRVSDKIRSLADWAPLSLTKPLHHKFQLFDFIFLRNILIYFSTADQLHVCKNVLSQLRVGGFLFTGHSEILRDRVGGLETVGPSIYRKIL